MLHAESRGDLREGGRLRYVGAQRDQTGGQRRLSRHCRAPPTRQAEFDERHPHHFPAMDPVDTARRAGRVQKGEPQGYQELRHARRQLKGGKGGAKRDRCRLQGNVSRPKQVDRSSRGAQARLEALGEGFDCPRTIGKRFNVRLDKQKLLRRQTYTPLKKAMRQLTLSGMECLHDQI